MDSFYPKFDEVELVLVDDDNDFYDPLETNFECEDENEDTKLQLNDTVYEDDQFNWSAEETTNNSSTNENNTTELIDSVEIVKLENSYENCDYKYGNTTNNVENITESDEKIVSYDTDQECFQNNDSNHSSDDERLIKYKPNPDDILKTTIEQKQNKIKLSDKIEEIEENVVKTEHVQTKKKKRLKIKRKKEETVTSSIKKEPKTKKKCIKEEKVVREIKKKKN